MAEPKSAESKSTETKPVESVPTGEPPERRSSRRFALRLPLTVSYPDGPKSGIESESRDVSARGICFYLDSAPATGSDIEFTLVLPPEFTATTSIHVHCKGKVVRVDTGRPSGRMEVAAVIEEYKFLPDE